MSTVPRLAPFLGLLLSLNLAGCGGGGGADEAGSERATSQGIASTVAESTRAPAPAPSSPTSTVTALTLRASAPVVDSIGAMLSIRYNGTARASIEVRSAELVDYRIELGVPIDGGVLEFVFTNATATQGRPLRHVRIDAMQLGSTTVHATDTLARFDRGAGSMAFDGLDLQAGRAVLVEHGSLRLRLPTATEIAAAQVTPLPTGYFVDAETGNDSHPGTAAQPWRSLTRASNMSLQAGQGLFLRCGRTWREPLVLNARQLKNGSMVAGYGPECLLRKAVISGASSWHAEDQPAFC